MKILEFFLSAEISKIMKQKLVVLNYFAAFLPNRLLTTLKRDRYEIFENTLKTCSQLSPSILQPRFYLYRLQPNKIYLTVEK